MSYKHVFPSEILYQLYYSYTVSLVFHQDWHYDSAALLVEYIF